jgi:hypothetical protein
MAGKKFSRTVKHIERKIRRTGQRINESIRLQITEHENVDVRLVRGDTETRHGLVIEPSAWPSFCALIEEVTTELVARGLIPKSQSP